MVCEFEPHVGLGADSSEPRACLGFCVSLSLCPSPVCVRSPKKKETLKKKKERKKEKWCFDACGLGSEPGETLGPPEDLQESAGFGEVQTSHGSCRPGGRQESRWLT